MSNHIVVGVTEASAARRAVDWAIARAVARKQPLELVAVVGGAIGTVGEGQVVDDALAAAQQLLDGEAARAREAGVEVSTRIGRGRPVDQLIEASAGAGLMVIGSDYRGPEGGRDRGAHGIRIVTGAECPVVVVPDFDLDDERHGVVVGIDGTDVSQAAISFAAAEADRLGEDLIAVSVWTPLAAPRNPVVYPELYLTNLGNLTQERLSLSLAGLRQDYPDLNIVERVERGYPSAVINEIAASARLTVMGSRGRGRLARFLLGSISHEVLSRLATVTAIVR